MMVPAYGDCLGLGLVFLAVQLEVFTLTLPDPKVEQGLEPFNTELASQAYKLSTHNGKMNSMALTLHAALAHSAISEILWTSSTDIHVFEGWSRQFEVEALRFPRKL